MKNTSEWVSNEKFSVEKINELYDHVVKNSDSNDNVIFASPRACAFLEMNRNFNWEPDQSENELQQVIIDGIEYFDPL